MENTADPRRGKRGHALVAPLILILGISLTIFAAYTTHRMWMRDAEVVFLSDARELARRVENEINAYEEVLTGLASFVESNDAISSSEFKRYVEGLNLPKRFPGFQNLNYAEQDQSRHVIRFIEPLEQNRPFLGRDLASLPGAEEALRNLRESGAILTAGRLIRGPGGHVGLAMRRAVYVPPAEPGNSRTFRGTVGAGYRPADLVRSVYDPAKFSHLRFRILDAGPAERRPATLPPVEERMLFDSVSLHPSESAQPVFRHTIVIRVGGRAWDVEIGGGAKTGISLQKALPWLVLAGGLLTTALLFALFQSITSSRRRAETLALEITHELRESENHLAEAQRMAALGNWWLDVERGRMHWSDESLRLLGRSHADAPTDFDALLACIHPGDRERLRRSLAGARLDAKEYDTELRLQGPDGAVRWIHALGQATLDEHGRISRLRGTFMDITARKIQERRTELEVVLSRLLASPHATAETLRDVLSTTAGMYGWSAARLWHVQPARAGLELAAAAGDLPANVQDSIQAMLQGASAGTVPWGAELFADKVSVWLGAHCDSVAPLPDSTPPEIGCALVLPVLLDGTVSDLLVFLSHGSSNCGDEATMHAMHVVASQLAHFLQRRRAEDSLKYVAMHDPLTGLPNRRHFHQDLSAGIARAERGGHGLGVLFVDLDRFKNINDAFGHTAGDAVLKACAERFRHALRESDLIAHISGDEFVVLLERCSEAEAAIAVARKLLEAVGKPILLGGQEITISASIGIAMFPPDGSDGETLLKHADIALFRAKEQGRNTYEFYSAQMSTRTAERLALEAKLRHALERGELALHYQPKLDIRTGLVTGAEALLRWTHPELGAVPPADFIPLAEETGLIVPIGAWVLREATRQARRWQESGMPGVRVAVNLSARQFRDPMLGQHVSRALAESGLDPRLLELEITESMVMQEPDKAAALLQDLKSMGLYLSIDDFGTGYSSLAYLKRFPIDAIKIDRSFIKDIPADPDDLAITQAVIAMAHSLRLRTVAEGVETEEQLDWLKRFGCEEMQGYLFSKPLPTDEAGRFLNASFRKEGPGRPGRSRPVAVA